MVFGVDVDDCGATAAAAGAVSGEDEAEEDEGGSEGDEGCGDEEPVASGGTCEFEEIERADEDAEGEEDEADGEGGGGAWADGFEEGRDGDAGGVADAFRGGSVIASGVGAERVGTEGEAVP